MSETINRVIIINNLFPIKCSTELLPAEPLYKRLPVCGQGGTRLNDLLMIFPGLKYQSASEQKKRLEKIESLLLPYKEDIVLAELNLKIGTLWLSFQSKPGLSAEIAAWLHHHLPESRLVAQHSDTET